MSECTNVVDNKSTLLELKRGWASPGEDRVNLDEITAAKDGVSRTSWLITKKMKG